MIDKYVKTFPYEIASVWAYRNEPEQAFTRINKAAEYQDTSLGEPPYDTLFAHITDDSRWAKFTKNIGKSPAQLDAIKLEVTLPQSN